jgi:glycosyltransferase involved in cell wall biosynthesis
MRISVVIPVFNEEATIYPILNRVVETQIASEIITVDDGSTDLTSKILKDFQRHHPIHIITHSKNQGKGSAVSTGLNAASGDIIILQDADLEYDPDDYEDLLQPIIQNKTDVVYGARFTERNLFSSYSLHYFANKTLTHFTNILYRSDLNDMETGYKVFKRRIFEGLNIRAKGFDFEPEFTAKLLKQGIKILEVPISFNPRSYSEGKKIKLLDAIEAIWTLLKYRFS